MTEIDRIVRLLEKTFEKQPWYGSSVTEILAAITPEVAETHHGPTHTIIDLVQHMTSWRQFAIQRLTGDSEFDITDETNFPAPTSWIDAKEGLHQSQRALVEAVRKFPVDRLDELVPSKRHKYTYYTLLHGIIQHDIYHLGQIALLKKLSSI